MGIDWEIDFQLDLMLMEPQWVTAEEGVSGDLRIGVWCGDRALGGDEGVLMVGSSAAVCKTGKLPEEEATGGDGENGSRF